METCPPDGAVAPTVKDELTGRSAITFCVITGTLGESVEVDVIATGVEAEDLSLSPTRFVADTFAV